MAKCYAVLNVSLQSWTGNTATYFWEAYVQFNNYYYYGTALSVKSSDGDTLGSASGYTTSAYGTCAYCSGTKTFLRNKDATRDISITVSSWGQTVSGYGSVGESHSATWTSTIQPVTTHTVTYNANGGSGAPSSQTKYYGDLLTLSSTKPTRSGYSFLGWATSSTSTKVAYAAGAQYGADEDVTLYAVWSSTDFSPGLQITNVYRCDGSGNKSSSGTYIHFTMAAYQSTDTSSGIAAENYANCLQIHYKRSTDSSWTTATRVITWSSSPKLPSSASYTYLSGWITIGSKSYSSTASLTHTYISFSSSATYQVYFEYQDWQNRSVTSATFVLAAAKSILSIDIASKGTNIAIGQTASEVSNLIELGLNTDVNGRLDINDDLWFNDASNQYIYPLGNTTYSRSQTVLTHPLMGGVFCSRNTSYSPTISGTKAMVAGYNYHLTTGQSLSTAHLLVYRNSSRGSCYFKCYSGYRYFIINDLTAMADVSQYNTYSHGIEYATSSPTSVSSYSQIMDTGGTGEETSNGNAIGYRYDTTWVHSTIFRTFVPTADWYVVPMFRYGGYHSTETGSVYTTATYIICLGKA